MLAFDTTKLVTVVGAMIVRVVLDVLASTWSYSSQRESVVVVVDCVVVLDVIDRTVCG